jgi:hypothetical protein
MPRQPLWVEILPGSLSTEINRFQPLPCLSNLLELPKPLLWGTQYTTTDQILAYSLRPQGSSTSLVSCENGKCTFGLGGYGSDYSKLWRDRYECENEDIIAQFCHMGLPY